MIITKLIGGLGNQMFQYAAGLALAKRNKSDIFVDISALRRYKKHNGYQFNKIFKKSPRVISNLKLISILNFDYTNVLYGPIMDPAKKGLSNHRIVFYQQIHSFNQDFNTLVSPCYLSGYWQSEKYFSDFEDDIRQSFSFNTPCDSANKIIAKKISNFSAVSMHIRRGDYVTESHTNRIHGVLPLDYYYNAMEYIHSKIPEAHFFVFSDDPIWVRRKINEKYSIHIVDINRGSQSYLDMYLMTLCNHHIIANSSFSWWGAFLGINKKKIVVAPKMWFNSHQPNNKDIYCNGWKVI